MCFPTWRCGVIAALLITFTTACSDDGPTTPSGPVPEIVRIDPSEVVPDLGPQTISITGQGFTTGLTVLVTPPNGIRRVAEADAIQNVQSVSFQASMVFDVPGDYLIAVRLLNGAESNEAKVSARAAGGSAPRIDAVTPGSVQAGPATTFVTLSGVNFGTSSTVRLTTPDGATNVLTASSVTSVTSTSIQLSIVFPVPGIYGLNVTNAQGPASNTVTITAF